MEHLLVYNGTDDAAAAFTSALVVGMSLHFHKIVKNEHWGYPQEWFPSVSATIGDRYPERSFFMIFIAITSGIHLTLGRFGLTSMEADHYPSQALDLPSLDCGISLHEDQGITFLISLRPWA